MMVECAVEGLEGNQNEVMAGVTFMVHSNTTPRVEIYITVTARDY